MKFQYVSDIHLEMGTRLVDMVNIPRVADNLILAGDIGNPREPTYTEFLAAMSEKFYRVFVIAGNHEFYSKKVGGSIAETRQLIAGICAGFKKNNVIFLDNSAYELAPDVSIFGTTLWTHIEDEDRRDMTYSIADYRCIPGFSVEVNNALHAEACHALRNAITQNPKKKWILVTHHLPMKGLIHPKYKGSPLNAAFAADIGDITEDPRILAVVYGHTHTGSVQGKYYCNPIGYPGENPRANLDTVFDVQW